MDKKLNFGCGTEILEGYDNVDVLEGKGIDKSFDFNKFPYPIKDNTYNYIYVKVVLEHLLFVKDVLKELHRIARKGAVINILVPYFNSFDAYSDVEHLHYFNDRAFTKNLNMNGYFNVKVKLISSKAGFLIPFRHFFSRYISGLIKQIRIELEVKK